jgi:hypothetical protein
MGPLPLADPPRARARLAALAEVGVTGLVHADRYEDAGAFARSAEALAALRG